MATIEDIQHIIFLYIACVLIMIGLLTSEWSVNRNYWDHKITTGLYRQCVVGHCTKNIHGPDITMVIMGFAASTICAVAMTVHYLGRKNSNGNDTVLPTITLGCAIMGAALVICACGLFGHDHFDLDVYPGYSFVLALVGAIFLIAGGAASAVK